MKPALIADTGPLYAAVDRDDQYHRRAQAELRKIEREQRDVVIAYPTLLEAYTLILYRLGSPTAARWLNEIERGALPINPGAEDYRAAIARVMSIPGQRITLFDAVVAVLADRLGAEAWTYDHHFDVMRVAVWR